MGTMTNNMTSGELRGWVAEHHDLDRELNYLTRRAYLTPAEQMRATQLKKLKLYAKDRIVAIRDSELPSFPGE